MDYTIVDTAQVRQIASELEKLNTRLSEELKQAKATVSNYGNIYKGEASNATVAAFEGFAAKYFQTYEDIIKQYVNFLRRNIAEGYEQVEKANTSLADNLK